MAFLDLITFGTPYLGNVDADPSAGGGLAAAIGSLVTFNNAGTGELYLKTGAAATAWTLISTEPDAGEANTASNVNVGGVGVFKQKTGVDLEFRGVNAASTKITVALDAGNNEIDIDVDEAQLTLDNIGGILGVAKGGTGLDASTVLDGQLLIGNDGNNDFDLATLTAGTNISIVNGAGSITINNTAAGAATEATVSTTDATVTTIATLDLSAADTTFLFVAKYAAQVTGGAGGFAGEVASFTRSYTAKNDGGVVTLQQTHSDQTHKDTNLSGYNVAGSVSGTDLLLRVTGGAADNVNWKVQYSSVSVA